VTIPRRKRLPIFKVFRDLGRPVFTTREFANLSGTSLSSTSQSLGRLAESGQIVRVARGLWCDPADPRFSSFALVPFLTHPNRGYVSFLTALHLHGIIEQIPQVIQVATTSHGRRVATRVGVFDLHRIEPRFFGGFDWYRGRQEFLVACPEKALVDCLYLSTRRGKRFRSFPELHLPRRFSARQAREWARRIPNSRIRAQVFHKLKTVLRPGTTLRGREHRGQARPPSDPRRYSLPNPHIPPARLEAEVPSFRRGEHRRLDPDSFAPRLGLRHARCEEALAQDELRARAELEGLEVAADDRGRELEARGGALSGAALRSRLEIAIQRRRGAVGSERQVAGVHPSPGRDR